MKSLSNYEIQQLIPKFVEFPYPADLNLTTEREFINPFTLIDTEKNDARFGKIKLNPSSIETLFSLASTDDNLKRQWGTLSLISLYKLQLLSKSEIVKLGKTIWSQIDDSGFPKNTQYYKFAFMGLPYPDIDLSARIKSYIENTNFPIQADKKSKSISITGGHIPLCNEIIGANKYVTWEQEELVTLFYRLVKWWDADKELLKKDDEPVFFCSTAEEFRRRFKNLIKILSEVIFPKLVFDSTSKPLREEIKRIVMELDEYGLITLKLKVIARNYLDLNDENLSIMVENSLCSSEHQVVIESLNVLLWILKNSSSFDLESINNIIEVLGQSIRWRYKVGFVSVLNVTKVIIRDYPQWNSTLEMAILAALDNLLKETELTQDINNDDFAERLQIREEAAGLAYQLYEHYIRDNTKIIPNVLLNWKNICSSEYEFSEIRIQWNFAIDESTCHGAG